LVAQSSSQYVGSVGWQTFVVPQTSLSSGYYWLSASTNNYWAAGVMSMTGSSNSHCWTSSTYNNEFSSSFGWSAGSDSGVPSIYATYTPTATPSTQSSLFSQGIVAPTNTPNVNNLIPIDDGQWYTDIYWRSAPADGVLLSTSVTHNGNPSWFIPLTPTCFGVDHALDVSPGDHIVFSCWIKTSGATLSADYNNPQAGGRLGIDFYGSLGGISATSVPDGTMATDENPWVSTDEYNTYVPFGQYGNDWTKVTMDFVVPAQIEYLYGITGQTGQYADHEMVTPTYCIVWMMVWSDTQGFNEKGTAWFSEPTFYINP